MVKNSLGLQTSQGTFVPVLVSPNAIYLEANFATAVGGCSYKTTTLRIEYFTP